MATPERPKKKVKKVKSALKYQTPQHQAPKHTKSATDSKKVSFAYPISQIKNIPKIGRLKASDW
eukprot:CAMPEP_0175179904 /NCGR_PEP_ID=MMETSP0087-20121206/35779_1 /TAXON_ID=136419 /ORGANISM="Unknown Unknown, Strain D1" /LENGTH=63 /DNA_ID=CAMNT_0016472201 /DNA_START=91 /DNA_END=279 /DNA_ORIENTATION=-